MSTYPFCCSYSCFIKYCLLLEILGDSYRVAFCVGLCWCSMMVVVIVVVFPPYSLHSSRSVMMNICRSLVQWRKHISSISFQEIKRTLCYSWRQIVWQFFVLEWAMNLLIPCEGMHFCFASLIG